jgi:hypothetical protein
LRDLVNFRRRCKDNLITCLDSFLKVQPPGPSNMWVNCPIRDTFHHGQNRLLPTWLTQFLSRNQNDLKLQKFTHPLDIHSRIRQEYFAALQTHLGCNVCLGVHATKGPAFCAELENKLAEARELVSHSFHLLRTTRFTSRRYAVIPALFAV